MAADDEGRDRDVRAVGDGDIQVQRGAGNPSRTIAVGERIPDEFLTDDERREGRVFNVPQDREPRTRELSNARIVALIPCGACGVPVGVACKPQDGPSHNPSVCRERAVAAFQKVAADGPRVVYDSALIDDADISRKPGEEARSQSLKGDIMTRLIQIPAMPDLWDMPKLYVSHKGVSGALAQWAVRQSPYTAPDNLKEAVEEFARAWAANFEDYREFDSAYLKESIKDTITACPLIVAWNERKNGRDGHGFVTRYDKPDPDDDFIDLDALAHNVTHELVLWAQVEAAQEEGRGGACGRVKRALAS